MGDGEGLYFPKGKKQLKLMNKQPLGDYNGSHVRLGKDDITDVTSFLPCFQFYNLSSYYYFILRDLATRF